MNINTENEGPMSIEERLRAYSKSTGIIHPSDLERDIEELIAERDALRRLSLVKIAEDQREWSTATFGPGARPRGTIDHIRKELAEIEKDPTDLAEWVDVIILAIDGAWRAGHVPVEIAEAVTHKQAINRSRSWPDWRTADPTKAIEHNRDVTVKPEPTPWPTAVWRDPHDVAIEDLRRDVDDLRRSSTSDRDNGQWRKASEDTAHAMPFGCIRECIDCGCLVPGGPTRCKRCAREVGTVTMPAGSPMTKGDAVYAVNEQAIRAHEELRLSHERIRVELAKAIAARDVLRGELSQANADVREAIERAKKAEAERDGFGRAADQMRECYSERTRDIQRAIDATGVSDVEDLVTCIEGMRCVGRRAREMRRQFKSMNAQIATLRSVVVSGERAKFAMADTESFARATAGKFGIDARHSVNVIIHEMAKRLTAKPTETLEALDMEMTAIKAACAKATADLKLPKRETPTATIAMLRETVGDLRGEIEGLRFSVKEKDTRIVNLLESNNRFEQQARDARAQVAKITRVAAEGTEP